MKKEFIETPFFTKRWYALGFNDEDLAELQQLPQKYLSVISEIHINEPKHGGFDLTLYPIKSNIRILMDRNLSEDSLQYMVVALDVVNSLAADITEIDLRYGSVSYRYR